MSESPKSPLASVLSAIQSVPAGIGRNLQLPKTPQRPIPSKPMPPRPQDFGNHIRNEAQKLGTAFQQAVEHGREAVANQMQKTGADFQAKRQQLEASAKLHTGLPWLRKRRRSSDENTFFLNFSTPRQKADALAAKALECERLMHISEAKALYEEASALVPGDVYLLSRLSKQWSDEIYIPGMPLDTMKVVNTKAVEIGRQAVEANPKSALGHIACCISMGRLALYSDNKTKVALAADAQDEARRALLLEPNNDLAHHLMGRWHYEMAQLNVIVRTLVRVMYGTTLSPGTHQDAMESYQRAVELNPKRLIHKVELGRCHAKLGNKALAVKELQDAMSLEVEDVNAHWTKVDGELLLRQLQRKGWAQLSLFDSIVQPVSGHPPVACA